MHADAPKPPLGRTLLILGRVSNLPTVWSNCLAGWLLAGGQGLTRFAILCAGSSLLYIGGMYLNDACDHEFDQQHRADRPIPNGAIAAKTVWILGGIWLAIGLALLAALGGVTGFWAFGLVACILIYDFCHKKTAAAPVIMSACRFVLYLVAASTAASAFAPVIHWSALGLAIYIIGLSYLARREALETRINRWALVLLLAPVIISLLQNGIPSLVRLGAMLTLVAWTAWCVSRLSLPHRGAIGRAVSGLLAGIPLVDLLAVTDHGRLVLLVFPLLFGVALVLQRAVPAT